MRRLDCRFSRTESACQYPERTGVPARAHRAWGGGCDRIKDSFAAYMIRSLSFAVLTQTKAPSSRRTPNHSLSKIPAAPMPPPTHIVTIP